MSINEHPSRLAEFFLDRRARLEYFNLDDYSALYSRKYFKKPLLDILKPFKGAYQIKENINSFFAGLKKILNSLICEVLILLLVITVIPLFIIKVSIMIPILIVVIVMELFGSGYKTTGKLLGNFFRNEAPDILLGAGLAIVAVFDAIALTILNLAYAVAQIISPLKIILRGIITFVLYGFHFQPIEENPAIKKLVSKDWSLKTGLYPHELRDLGVHKIAIALNKGQFTKFIPVSTELSSEVRAAKIFYKMSVAAKPTPVK